MNVVNVKVSYIRPKYNNLKEWINDENNVYIGRKHIVFIDGKRFPDEQSIWANPFKIKKDGNRKNIMVQYERYIREKIDKGEITKHQLMELKNKTLGCWCKPEECHGDILKKIVNEFDMN